jgi:hypothetical protein
MLYSRPSPPLKRQPLAQIRRLPNHLHGITEQDHRLVAVRSRRVNLGPGLAIGGQAIKADASSERRLAVALALFDVGAAEPPRSVRPLPTEQRADLECLCWGEA